MATFEVFKATLVDLVSAFDADGGSARELDEANLRLNYLDEFFTALGWDVGNKQRVPPFARDVVVEPPSQLHVGRKRPDYLFRVNGIDKFICEAKRPRTNIEQHYFQVQNYVYNLKLWIGVLFNFEFLIVFVVGGQPDRERPFAPPPGWRLYYSQFVNSAQGIWDLFSREQVEGGSLERFAQSLPKVARKGQQGWLLKPDKNRTVDNDFLNYLEFERERLGRLLHNQNPNGPNARGRGWTGRELTEAAQVIIDRILFQRVCEDRAIDVGRQLKRMADEWANTRNNQNRLWPALVANFKHLKLTFNGGIYGKHGEDDHFVDRLMVDDRWLSDFIDHLSSDDSTYIFSIMPVEILGSVYERFLGSVITADGDVEPKPEVRHAGGVYYTPSYIVDFIVEKTIGELLVGKTKADVDRLRILDPSCGSGSFLLRAFERLCEFYVSWFIEHPEDQKADYCYIDKQKNLRLTTGFKRNVLTRSIYGVDLDPQAVEVTQMSLYLKVLEGETRESLDKDHTLFPTETYLPDLGDNVKSGNSLIGLDSLRAIRDQSEVVERVRPFDWEREFPRQMKSGGFDVVIGNPPYVSIQTMMGWAPYEVGYLKAHYKTADTGNFDLYVTFVEKGLSLLKKSGRMGFILPNKFFTTDYGESLREILTAKSSVKEIVDFEHDQVFDGATTYTCLLFLAGKPASSVRVRTANASPGIDASPTFEVHLAKGRQPWLLQPKEVRSLIEKLDRCGSTLGDMKVSIARGSSSGADPIFCLLEEGNRLTTRAGREVDIEAGILRTPIFATDFARYDFRGGNGEKIIFPYDVSSAGYKLLSPRNLKASFPKAYKYLLANKKRLIERKQYQAWYSFSAPRSLDVHESADFIVPLLANKGTFSPYPSKGKFCLMASGGFSLSFDKTLGNEERAYILGLLNSKLLFWRLRKLSNKFSGGWITCTKQYVSKLPIAKFGRATSADRKLQERIAEESKSLMIAYSKLRTSSARADEALSVRMIDNAENAIDMAVYDLYKVTDAERSIVEAAVKKGWQLSTPDDAPGSQADGNVDE